MRRSLWALAGVIAGTLLANLIAYGWETLILPRLPFAAAIDTFTTDAAPQGTTPIWLWIAAGWLISTFVGAFAAFRISYSDFAGWIVAAVFAAMSIGYVWSGGFPFWLELWAVAGPFIGALFAFGAYRRWRAAHLHLRRVG